MSVLKRRDAEIRDKELRARSLVADIIPMLDRLSEEAVDEVADHLDKALKVCEEKAQEARDTSKVK